MRPLALAAALALPLALAACGGSREEVVLPQAFTTPQEGHPIAVVRDARVEIVLVDERGRLAADPAQMRDLVVDHARRGHGPIKVEGPARDVRTAAQALVQAGAKVRDLDLRVGRDPRGATVSFEAFRAEASPCGAFVSDSARFARAADARNSVSSEWGCATQSNLAAMVSDPLDLVGRHGRATGSNSDYAVGRQQALRTYAAPDRPSTSSFERR